MQMNILAQGGGCRPSPYKPVLKQELGLYLTCEFAVYLLALLPRLLSVSPATPKRIFISQGTCGVGLDRAGQQQRLASFGSTVPQEGTDCCLDSPGPTFTIEIVGVQAYLPTHIVMVTVIHSLVNRSNQSLHLLMCSIGHCLLHHQYHPASSLWATREDASTETFLNVVLL